MKANCVVIHCSTIFLFSELQRIWMPPSSVVKVQSIYIVGSKYYSTLCLLVPLSKPFQFATEQTNDETSVMFFWHFQKIQHVISNLEGLNLHPNMSSVKLTQALSFVLWGKNKFKKKKKTHNLLLSAHTFSCLLKSWEMFCLSKRRFWIHVTGTSSAPRVFAVIRCGPNPPKLPVCGMGTMLYLFTLFFKGRSCEPLMFLECKQYCSSSSTFASITVSALFRNCPIC